MRIPFPGTVTSSNGAWAIHMPGEKTLRWAALAAIVLLAAFLRLSNIQAIGWGNTYYTAAVKSMLQSWHNFFFVAAEPGGSVSVDKPPVGFWLQAISAYFLGVNGFAVVLPQIIAGLLSVVVVYHLVRRSFGTAAGLLAALALAITPVVIATDRNNTIDSTLILTLLLAAWAFIKATESSKLRYLLLGALLVGIGFNIKMLEAFLPLPAFYAAYFLGAQDKLWPKIGKLALATIVLLVVSLSWAVAVDLTPADQRPYVGSSSTNSELNLIVGYNGMERLLGMFGRGRRNGVNRQGANGFAPPYDGQPNNGQFAPPVGSQPGNGQFDGQTRPDDGRQFGPGGPGGPGGQGAPGGPFDTGIPGPLRLFIAPLSKNMSWLLPFGLLSMGVLAFGKPKAFSRRLRWPVSPEHQALIVWGGWLVTAGVFFSIAGFFHEYYLSTMAPPLAALIGIGAAGLWNLRKGRPWLAFALLLIGGGVTLAFQALTALSFTQNVWWLAPAAAVMVAGLVLVAFSVRLSGTTEVVTTRAGKRLRVAGYSLVMAALLITPLIWSGLTTFRSSDTNLPAAYGGSGFRSNDRGGFRDGRSFTGGQFNGAPNGPQGAPAGAAIGPGNGGLQVNQDLLAYLQQNTQGIKYLLAVPSSHDGDGYILATGRPVLLMGGFNGGDPVVTASSLAELVAQGQLRYVQLGGGFGGPGGQINSGVSGWVTANCRAVTQFSSGGFGSGAGGGFRPGGGNLYDCGG